MKKTQINILCPHGLKELLLSIPPKAIYCFNVTPIKIPMVFFTEIEKTTIKSVQNLKRPQTATATLRKKSKAWGITLPDVKLYYRVIVNKREQYWHKNRKTDQWNRTKGQGINLQICHQLLYDKGVKNIQLGKDCLFHKWCWENYTATCKRMKLIPILCHT